MENIDWKHLALAESLLMRTTASTERVCLLQHYPQVVAAYITLQTVFSLTVSITGLSSAHSDCVAYQDVKELRILLQKCNVSLHYDCFELYHCQ